MILGSDQSAVGMVGTAVESQTGFPQIAGNWTMSMEWRRDGKHGQLVANARIAESAHGLNMTVEAPNSDSHTLLARWAREPSDAPVLYYIFQVEPKASGPEPATSYKGAAVLRFQGDGVSLSGNYWTDQLSAGHYELTRAAGSGAASLAQTRGLQKPVKRGWEMCKQFGILGAIILLGVLFFLLSPLFSGGDAWERRIDFAVKKASEACLLDSSTEVKRDIEAGLSARLKSLGGRGATTEQTTRRSVNEAFSEAGQMAQDERLRTCVTERTDYFLVYQPGTATVRAQSIAVNDVPSTTAPTAEAGQSGAAVGYVYYEEDHGSLTQDGVFGPPDGARAIPYQGLREGMVLKSVKAAQLRGSDRPNSLSLLTLPINQCVQVLAPPAAPRPNLTAATSGGRIKVRAVSCPIKA